MNYPKDVLMKIGMDLDIPTLMSYCRSSSDANRATCDNQDFWRRRLKQDFNRTDGNPKERYKRIYEGITNVIRSVIDGITVNEKYVNIDLMTKDMFDAIVNVIVNGGYISNVVGDFSAYPDETRSLVSELNQVITTPIRSNEFEWNYTLMNGDIYYRIPDGKQSRPGLDPMENHLLWLNVLKIYGTEKDIVDYFVNRGNGNDIMPHVELAKKELREKMF